METNKKYYGQNAEDLIMWTLVETEMKKHYGKDFKGRILDLGANDGEILSNSLLFIENGWEAVCVEPAPIAFKKLQERHKDNHKVLCYQLAISDYNGESDLYDSGTHFGKGDTSLLSTLNVSEKDRWGDTTTFEKVRVPVKTFETFAIECPKRIFDIISIDCEGEDFKILQQMNLFKTKTSIICIEWNSVNFKMYDDWLKENWPGCNLVKKNAENLIYYRQYRKMEGV